PLHCRRLIRPPASPRDDDCARHPPRSACPCDPSVLHKLSRRALFPSSHPHSMISQQSARSAWYNRGKRGTKGGPPRGVAHAADLTVVCAKAPAVACWWGFTAVKVIVGLGNPGLRYMHTRHNAGFESVELFAAARGWSWDTRKQHRSLLAGGTLDGK